MGIQDRDWYREEMRKRQREEERAEAKARPRARQQVSRSVSGSPPRLIGADWHWSLQLLVWLCIAVLAIILIRLLGL